MTNFGLCQNFKWEENGRKFYKRLENTEEEIARDKQFFLFPHRFQNACRSTADT